MAAFVGLRQELDAGVAVAERCTAPKVGQYIPVRMVEDYRAKHRPTACEWHPNARLFPGLVKFVEDRLPFLQWGRLLIMPSPSELHIDYSEPSRASDSFVWAQVGDKRLYILDGTTKQKHYVTARFGWFDGSDLHGSDAPAPGAYSIRADGIFTEEFKRRLGERFRT